MPHPTGPTDPNLLRLIIDLKKEKNKSYSVLAKHLQESRRAKRAVNVGKINKLAQSKHSYAVPGKILAEGNITKPVTVYAWSYSAAAKDKIQRAGGECMSLHDLLKGKPKVKIVM